MEKDQIKGFFIKNEKNKNPMRQIGVFVLVPFILAVPPIIGWLIGRWLDKLLGTAPYLMYLFLFFGFISGFRELYRLLKKFGNEE